MPETVYRASRYFSKLKTTMPMIEVKLYTYQLFRSLAYIHSQGICHRDIKPQNLLLDPHTGILKLCDFGSAKILVPNEPNVSYICSRYYRAPELIFGATNYTTKIGMSCESFLQELQCPALPCSIKTSIERIELLKFKWSSFFHSLTQLSYISNHNRFHQHRCLVDRLCHGRIDAWAANVPRRVRNRPAC